LGDNPSHKRIRFTQRQDTSMTTTTLQDQLDEITANTRQLVQAERLAIGEQAVAELFASGIEEKILPVGAIAPQFTLKDATGRMVRSADLLALGPLVIKFFRGRWCSYCVTELEAWRDLYGTLREHDALMVAIGPKNSDSSIPYPSTTSTTTAPSSLTFRLSTESQAGVCPSQPLMSSPKTARCCSPRPTPTSASGPSQKKRSPPRWRPGAANPGTDYGSGLLTCNGSLSSFRKPS